MKNTSLFAAFAALGLVASAAPSAAAGISFTNGGFEQTTNGAGQLGFNTDATGWVSGTPSNRSYAFLFPSGTADSTGAIGEFGGLSLWGPNNGSNNGLPASSPSGGNFIAVDGDLDGSGPQSISQSISGLTVGQSYTVGFDYGFAQQSGFDGETNQSWSVSLGNQTKSTATTTVANHGFSGWLHTNLTFVADASTDVLTFVAVGDVPVPPFALLDGVTVDATPVATPEPATIGLLLAGAAGLVGLRRARR